MKLVNGVGLLDKSINENFLRLSIDTSNRRFKLLAIASMLKVMWQRGFQPLQILETLDRLLPAVEKSILWQVGNLVTLQIIVSAIPK